MIPHETPSDPPASPAADFELVQRARRGDDDAIDELVRRMRSLPRILRAIDRHHGARLDDHELADLAQDTAVLMWRKLATFSGQATIETWAYGIGRFEYLNTARRKSLLEGRRADLDGEIPAASEARDANRDEEDLHAILGRIPAPEAAVLRLKHAFDMTFDEIGRELSIPANTAKTRYYRGLQALTRELSAADALRRKQ